MNLLYKTFRRARQSLNPVRAAALAALIAVSFGVSQARAQDMSAAAPASPYTVQNINVDASAENALKARDLAFEQAQVKAFEELATRMIEGEALSTFAAPPLSTIGPMIQDYEITDEKLSSKRYVGTYTFRFDPAAVQSYFGGIAPAAPASVATDGQSPAPGGLTAPVSGGLPGGKGYLVLPYMEWDSRTEIWSPRNAFLRAWMDARNAAEGPVSVMAPTGDLDDVRAVTDNAALRLSSAQLSPMLARYGAAEIVLLIAEKMPDGALNIDIYRTDSPSPRFVRQITVPAMAGDQALFAAAVRDVRALLQGDWKNPEPALASTGIGPSSAAGGLTQSAAAPVSLPSAAVAAAPADRLPVRVRFASLQEWTRIQQALARTYGMNDIALRSLSPREANLDLSFNGNVSALQTALAQAGLTLTAPGPETAGAAYEISLPPSPASAASGVSGAQNPYQARF